MDLKNKKILVTGSEGLIGRELVIQLKELGAKVIRFDIKKVNSPEYFDGDITEKFDLEECFRIEKPQYVFNCFGIKGNPKMTKENPTDFMVPMLLGDTNCISLAQKYKVKRFLYTSSIAVENPETDFYPATAKLTAERLIEAMRIQYPNGTKYCIVRPSNIYGKFDNFNSEHPMIVTKLIKEGMKIKKNKKWVLDKKGSNQIRDLINAKDVATGMIKALEEMPQKPVNLCSGKETKIKDIAEIIAKSLNLKIEYKDLKIVLGPNKKIMMNPYIKPLVSLEEGIVEILNKEKYESEPIYTW